MRFVLNCEKMLGQVVLSPAAVVIGKWDSKVVAEVCGYAEECWSREEVTFFSGQIWPPQFISSPAFGERMLCVSDIREWNSQLAKCPVRVRVL